MYRKYIQLCIWQLFAIVLPAVCCAQNLINNPGFEDYNVCPSGISGIQTSSYPTVKSWLNPLYNTSPDYFNVCAAPSTGVHVPEATFGYQWAHTGDAYAGMILWEERPNGDRFGEYLHTRLSLPMQAGKKYCVTFWVNNAINTGMPFNYLATDEIGVSFSNNQVSQTTGYSLSMPYHISNPAGRYIADTTNWVKITGIYTAVGGEEWMTIGRFDNSIAKPKGIVVYPAISNPANATRTYVYIDDVNVTMLTKADTFLTKHDSVYCDKNNKPTIITSRAIDGDSYEWNNGAHTASINITADGTYWCKAVAGCAVYIDTFIVKDIGNAPLSLGRELVNCNNNPVTISSNIKYGSFIWSTGETTSEITVNTPGTYWLRITNACGVFTDTVRVYIQSATPPPVVKDTSLCQLVEAPVLNNVKGKNLVWYIHPASTVGSSIQPQIYTKEPDKATLYVAQKIGMCESEKIPVNINILYQPKKELPYKTEMCSFSPRLIGTEYPGVKYLWDNGSDACCIMPKRSGIVRVSISNQCGEYTDSTRVVFLPCDECTAIPNAFTPNGDGLNDKFYVMQTCPIAYYHIRIFNRWGQQVFESKDIREGWTGRQEGLIHDQGTYIYILEYAPEATKILRQQTGSITLLK